MFDTTGVAATWAPLTLSKNAKGYGRWLTWLQAQDLLEPYIAPELRVTPERVAHYVADLQASTAANTVVIRVQKLYLTMGALSPAGDWVWIQRIERRLRMTATSIRHKGTQLVPIDELFQLGLESMAEGERLFERHSPVHGATLYRNGLMISLLAARPFRRRNFTAIEIGRRLLAEGRTYRLVFQASETKSRQPIEARFPEALVACLEGYLTRFRPFLMKRTGQWSRGDASQCAPPKALWLSRDGTPMTQIAIYDQIVRLTEARFGHGINPHLFRDAAATSLAIDDRRTCARRRLSWGTRPCARQNNITITRPN